MKHGSAHENKTRDGRESDNAVEHKSTGRVLLIGVRHGRPILPSTFISLSFSHNLLCTSLESPPTPALAIGTSLYLHNIIHTMVWERVYSRLQSNGMDTEQHSCTD